MERAGQDEASRAVTELNGDDGPDDLDRMIADYTAENPEFPQLVEAALAQRQLLRQLARVREDQGLSQQAVARRMKTSQSAIARLERGESNPTLATIGRYAAVLGRRIEWKVRPASRVRRGRAAAQHT